MQNIFAKTDEIIRSAKPAALCVVISTEGSTPRKAGSKMLVYSDGSVFGSVGGGSVEKQVVEFALKLIGAGKPEKFVFNLEDDLGMHCGGCMEVYIEPVNPLQKLFIFGAGHIGRALAHYAKDFGFSITFFDPREKIFEMPGFEDFICVNKEYFEAIGEASFDQNTYIVIVTPKHSFDEEILARVALKEHAYVGMLGSSRKVAMARQRFLDEQILTEEQLNAIDMPVGIKFRAETPDEIAISILAKLIDVRNTILEQK
ncbi:MAG: XdhC family protein [Bacteroidetes bacterium]|nr:XdhC family protein [Bacteroidota bacterium]